ncbi:uncharacterized protein [Bemisia tabaci]|uniref:Salivary secreted peptide n=2 Tax=Bemisia tabaci TaxID=7038 RepID=A0A9E8AGF8_BEMTA|nr:hypothetical protein [Bemisia tabaci]
MEKIVRLFLWIFIVMYTLSDLWPQSLVSCQNPQFPANPGSVNGTGMQPQNSTGVQPQNTTGLAGDDDATNGTTPAPPSTPTPPFGR